MLKMQMTFQRFKKVMGYANCLMVLQCQEDNATFVAYGDDVDKAFRTRKCDDLTITISKNDVKRSGCQTDCHTG